MVTERVIFARMSPENKVQVVQTLERAGKVCAMVGDGANDAAAIRAATVGIGVVARGSDSSSVAADVVLLDARIEALLNAIDEGRELWRRVQAAVSVLLGGNAGEVAFAIIGSAITGNSPLNTRQLLLVNIFTDALPAGRPGGQQAERSGADRRPRPRRAGAVASRRDPRRDHCGGRDGGVGDGRGHRTPATGVDGGTGRPGVSAAGSDAAGFAYSAGRADRGRLAGRDGDADQHSRRQPVAWLHAARPARPGRRRWAQPGLRPPRWPSRPAYSPISRPWSWRPAIRLRPSRHDLHGAEAPQHGVQLGQRNGQQARHSSA